MPGASAKQRVVRVGEELEQGDATVIGAAKRGRQSGAIQSAGSDLCVVAELSRTLQRVRGGPVRAPRRRSSRSLLEQAGSVRVWTDARGGEVPGPGIRPAVRRERLVGTPPLARLAALIRDRPYQGVRETELLGADSQHAGPLGVLERAGREPEVAAGGDHRRQLPVD